MKKNIKGLIKLLPYLIFIMIMAFILIPKWSANDLYFDLESADDILKYGLDFKDHFSFIPNLPYLYHHYLYNLILKFIYNLNGYVSIFIFFVSLYTILGFIIFFTNKKNINNNIISLSITILTLYLLKFYFATRVQSISYVIFFLEVLFLEKLYKDGNKKYAIFLILLSIILINIHMPVWIVYLILFLPFIAEILIDFIKEKLKISKIVSDKLLIEKSSNNKTFLITFLITVITGLASPFKLYSYMFFLKVSQNSNYEIIGEMQKTVLINQPYLLGLFIIGFIVLFILKNKVNFRKICLFLGLFILALFANRHIVYFYLIIPTILAEILYKYIKKLNLNIKTPNIKINKKIINCLVSSILIIFYIMCITSLDYKTFDYGEKDNYPKKTTKYIKENLDYENIILYNDFNYGSYLAFYDIPVFVDSRAEVYMKNFNGGKDIMGDYLKTKEYDNYKKILKKYNFEYLLIYKNSNLYDYLSDNSSYKIIFAEETLYALFKKV